MLVMENILSGKDDSLGVDDKGLGHAVVIKLLEGLEGRGHHVYTDNWYNSPALFDNLHSMGFGACGTLHLNRKGVPDILKRKLKMNKHETISAPAGQSLVTIWMDKRQVAMLSTIHDDSTVAIQRRRAGAHGGVEQIEKPLCIDDYNHFMNGIDRHDQLTVYYGFSHRHKKWWKRCCFHLIEVAIVNTYILYVIQTKQDRLKTLTHQRFRIQLAQQLLMDAGDAIPATQHKGSQPISSRLTERHFIAHYDETCGVRERHN